MKIYVEGGGDDKALKTACRKGFRQFLEKAGLKGNMPGIVACGSRQQAFKDFCRAIEHDEKALLLVDSEKLVDPANQQGDPKNWQPWEHLKHYDNWQCPPTATQNDCHLMVVCMEAWLIADRDTLAAFFGKKDFNASGLPAPGRVIESVPKADIFSGLNRATSPCPAGPYGKGKHSFELLGKVDPAKVIAASPWAKRFKVDPAKVIAASPWAKRFVDEVIGRMKSGSP